MYSGVLSLAQLSSSLLHHFTILSSNHLISCVIFSTFMWTFPLTYVNGFTQIYLAKTTYDGYFNTYCLFTTLVHKWE